MPAFALASSQVLHLLIGRIAAVYMVTARLRARLCLPGTKDGGGVRSASHEKQKDKEAEAVSARTRPQTKAQTSKARRLQRVEVAFNHAVQRML